MKIIEIPPYAPAGRHLQEIVNCFEKGGLVIYPTDAGYSVGCLSTHTTAIKKLYALKKPLKKYVMALMFSNLSNITEYAKVDNFAYRIMKQKMPGPYTFLLPAQIHISRKLAIKRQEIGVRMPDTPLMQEILPQLSAPILNTAARLHEDEQFTSPGELIQAFQGKVDLLLDSDEVLQNPTNIISLLNNDVEILRGEL